MHTSRALAGTPLSYTPQVGAWCRFLQSLQLDLRSFETASVAGRRCCCIAHKKLVCFRVATGSSTAARPERFHSE
jgi:hypothetical protein